MICEELYHFLSEMVSSVLPVLYTHREYSLCLVHIRGTSVIIRDGIATSYWMSFKLGAWGCHEVIYSTASPCTVR